MKTGMMSCQLKNKRHIKRLRETGAKEYIVNIGTMKHRQQGDDENRYDVTSLRPKIANRWGDKRSKKMHCENVYSKKTLITMK